MEKYSGTTFTDLDSLVNKTLNRVPTCPVEFQVGQRGYICSKIADKTCSVCGEPYCSEHLDECQKCSALVCGCCSHNCGGAL